VWATSDNSLFHVHIYRLQDKLPQNVVDDITKALADVRQLAFV
jgi:hypothetical protein